MRGKIILVNTWNHRKDGHHILDGMLLSCRQVFIKNCSREAREQLFCLCPVNAEKTVASLLATQSNKPQSVQLSSDDLDEAMSAHESVLKRRTVKRRALQRERGLNSRHVLIKKEQWVLTASPPASLVSTQRPPSPPPQARAQNVSTQIRTGDQGMCAWEEWVAGGLVGWRAERGGGERGGACGESWGGGREVLSNLGVPFGVWKTVWLFQLKCNISSEHAVALWRSELRLETGHCHWSHFSIRPLLVSRDWTSGTMFTTS